MWPWLWDGFAWTGVIVLGLVAFTLAAVVVYRRVNRTVVLQPSHAGFDPAKAAKEHVPAPVPAAGAAPETDGGPAADSLPEPDRAWVRTLYDDMRKFGGES